MPFRDLSPLDAVNKSTKTSNRQLTFEKYSGRLHFRTRTGSDDESESDYKLDASKDDDDKDDDEELLRDFDIIDVIPGFGEPPKNNQEFEVKMIRKTQQPVQIKDDHFKKPLTKIDVLKAPDTYPIPLNVYCVQEISITWFLYGGNDFGDAAPEPEDSIPTPQPSKMNRTVSSPVLESNLTSTSKSSSHILARSRNNSTSSSLSLSPQQQVNIQNSSVSPTVRFSVNKSINYSKEKSVPRKAGGRITTKYDTNSLNWMERGGRGRNLEVCMEIGLHKVKTKFDLYTDLNTLNDDKENESSKFEYPYLYRVALAVGDIGIKDKLASSPFNMFLFRYESDHCPKHTNSNMIFLKFLCSRSMDAQRLIECDIKVSIQPLRFNIDQDAIIFMEDFFTKIGSKDLNEFKKNLIAPAVINLEDTSHSESASPQRPAQQIFIRNFIFSPDLLVRFDFSGKYDSRPDTKLDTIPKLLMVVVQLSNTEIKLKRVIYRRGFLGAEKLFQALVKEWLTDIQRNQMKNIIKGWGIFNSLIQFFEGFTYLIWYPIEQYKKDGRVLCGIQKGSAAFSTCTLLATIELTNRMFQTTKNIAEFFYDLVTPHRAGTHSSNLIGSGALVDTILTGVGNNRNIRLRRHPNDIRDGVTNAYYVMYQGMNDTAANLLQGMQQGAEQKGIAGAIGGVLTQLPSAAIAPIVLGAEATVNILTGIRNQLKPDEKRDDDQKWKTVIN